MNDDWGGLTRRASFESHRLIGWVYWDPVAIQRYGALGVPNGAGYYIASRAAPLAAAGTDAVTAAFGSIHAGFVSMALDLCRQHTTFADAARVRNEAVSVGLRTYVPEIVDSLGELAPQLWAVVNGLPLEGRVLFGAHRQWPRAQEDAALSAWLALNCIREWRGDTHWAIQVADGLSPVAAGILDGAWRDYPDEWLPRSRGADDASLAAAMAELDDRGFVDAARVNAAGIAHRQEREDRLDAIGSTPWRQFGHQSTIELVDLIAPVSERLMARVDATAGPNWMPAGRIRPTSTTTSEGHS
jgi:hypothetical protein